MGKTFSTGLLTNGIWQDASNNIGIGGSPSGTYKLEVTGTAKVSGILTLGSTISNGTYTYTLPSATGTLALTSALGDYLPLTGGTLTGALSGTSATFSSSVTAGSLIVNQASTAADIILKFQINGTNKWLVGLTNDVVDDNFTIYQDGAGGGNRFTINTSGNVGIGTTTPGEKFVVQTTANNWTGNFIGNTTSGQSLGLLVTAGTNSADSAFYIQNTTGSFNSFKVRGDGWLVSPTTYNNTSGVAANVGIDSAGNIFRATSSIKYKTNIKPYDKGLDSVLLMNPIYYKSISDFDGDKQFAGFIAEEIDELGLKEFVQYNDENNEPEGLNYGNITAILVKAIQELSAQNQDLKSRLDKAGL